MCENPSVAERWNADRFADVILPDGETREVRVAKDTSSSASYAAAETPTRGFPRYRARRRGAARRVPHLPRDEEGPVFAEPWQAQAFALAVKLSEQGYFTWN